MILMKMNRYILKNIFSNILTKKQLNIVKYNNKLMKKIDINKYAIQKFYFQKISSQFLLDNPEQLLISNIFDEQTLKKLSSDWDKDTSSKLEKNKFFDKIPDPKVLGLIGRISQNHDLLKVPSLKIPKLLELNLVYSEMAWSIELPCVILSNLVSLSLRNIYTVTFLSNDSRVSLEQLEHLYLSNAFLDEKQDIKIDIPNLNYLDLRMNKEEDVIGVKFGYKDLFGNMKKLIDIFNFEFLSIFTLDEKYLKNKNKFFPGKEIDYTFQKPELLFQEKYIKQFEYFKLNISYGFLTGSGEGIEEKYIISRKYLFSKTKSDKYLFRTIFRNENTDPDYKLIKTETRYCNGINPNDYYFRNKKISLQGYGSKQCEEKLYDEDIDANSLKFTKNNQFDFYYSDIMNLLNKFESNNNSVESIYFDVLDKSVDSDFLDNIKKFLALKSFIVDDNCLLSNKNLLQLFKILSGLKNLLIIDIAFKKKINLTNDEKKELKKLFPHIEINKKNDENRYSINWENEDCEKLCSIINKNN